ncbi:SDR family oxidoreductase [Nocardioides humilatus]|uniref:SDR family oxidoreductase n=1 Tax=Nocardioides humilatus TaxID=2607660 RepID=A0A5B1LB85_9ACTN|nr:SDR family oxidoreductase [Nocardioides humilatus]KAA1416949.1 SDR family oxidoreductase [Nocardioides humilatus]
MFGFNEKYDVCDKVVLVTGAGSGIGAALVEILHRRGARVALVDVNDGAIQATAERLGAADAWAMAVDVRDREAMAKAVDQVVEHFGQLDVVVANAGVAPGPSTLRTIAPDEFDRVVDINLIGVFNTVHPALDHVIANRGHVVVVSSAAAFAPGAGLASYMASKAAVEALGRALRIELAAHGASAGVAYFGFVQTPFVRPLDEDPIARQVDAMMPWPFNHRVSAHHAARVLAEGIEHRSASTMTPVVWTPYAWFRGPLNVVVDAAAATSQTMHRLIRAMEDES